MPKLEDIATFNLEDKTYTVESLNTEAKELLGVYLETEMDIVRIKKDLVKAQHALTSMGGMFKEMLKGVEPISADELNRLAAAQALAQAAANDQPTAAPKKKPAVKRLR